MTWSLCARCIVRRPVRSQQDESAAALPDNIAVILHTARILLGYGRHLLDTIPRRANAADFYVIAECFGTSNLPPSSPI